MKGGLMLRSGPDRLLHYFGSEGWADIEVRPFIIGRSLVLQCLDSLVHLLETPLYISVASIVGYQMLWWRSPRGGVPLGLGSGWPSLLLGRTPRATLSRLPLWFWLWWWRMRHHRGATEMVGPQQVAAVMEEQVAPFIGQHYFVVFPGSWKSIANQLDQVIKLVRSYPCKGWRLLHRRLHQWQCKYGSPAIWVGSNILWCCILGWHHGCFTHFSFLKQALPPVPIYSRSLIWALKDPHWSQLWMGTLFCRSLPWRSSSASASSNLEPEFIITLSKNLYFFE